MPLKRFHKAFKLRKRYEFASLSHNAHIFKGKVLLIAWKRTSNPRVRLGITVTKKYGTAVARNRFKRMVREAFRLLCCESITGVDCNVRPYIRSNSKDQTGAQAHIDFTEVVNDFTTFFATITASGR